MSALVEPAAPQTETQGAPPVRVQPAVSGQATALFREIYDSIPFSRVAQDSNPLWRHQAALSLAIGQPVPLTPVPKVEDKPIRLELEISPGFWFPQFPAGEVRYFPYPHR